MALPVGRYMYTCTCSYTCTCTCVSMYFELYCTLYLSKHTLVYLSIHVQGYVHIGSVPASPHGSTGYPAPQLEWACPSEERQRWIGSHGEASWDDSVGGVSQRSCCWIENLTSSLPGHYDQEFLCMHTYTCKTGNKLLIIKFANYLLQ